MRRKPFALRVCWVNLNINICDVSQVIQWLTWVNKFLPARATPRRHTITSVTQNILHYIYIWEHFFYEIKLRDTPTHNNTMLLKTCVAATRVTPRSKMFSLFPVIMVRTLPFNPEQSYTLLCRGKITSNAMDSAEKPYHLQKNSNL